MIIAINNLIVQHGSLRVLDIPEWSTVAGSQVAISGSSGSGKTTLLNVIAGLIVPRSGKVTVCGKEISNAGEAERDRFRATHVGYVFQNFNLLQGYTALENVLLGLTFAGCKADRAKANEVLEEMGLSARARHYPSEMSIGETQRVAVARALVKNPELILADEPTGSLDPANTAEVLRLLKTACKRHGSTLIVVTHEEDIASSFANRINFLELNHAFGSLGEER